MGLLFEIDATLKRFIEAQPMFFVSTAPLSAEGHINLSPKGLGSFRILGPKQVAYLDVTGSGVETIAHLKENGRIVFMFCAFQGPPTIVRLHGHGRVIEPAAPEFAAMAPQFPDYSSARSIIVADITRVADSCGYGVPLMRYEDARQQHFAWAEKKGTEGLKTYRKEKNSRSIDGLQGLSE
ncbi:MAG TPA: pyridoxamine 5'-phosphate oxidase family protein [Candidatus Solibacter sp.]|nr:pyridoxamine 5'-phosphate oxidase family protein [Candidatus Solibacter sp.]